MDVYEVNVTEPPENDLTDAAIGGIFYNEAKMSPALFNMHRSNDIRG